MKKWSTEHPNAGIAQWNQYNFNQLNVYEWTRCWISLYIDIPLIYCINGWVNIFFYLYADLIWIESIKSPLKLYTYVRKRIWIGNLSDCEIHFDCSWVIFKPIVIFFYHADFNPTRSNETDIRIRIHSMFGLSCSRNFYFGKYLLKGLTRPKAMPISSPFFCIIFWVKRNECLEHMIAIPSWWYLCRYFENYFFVWHFSSLSHHHHQQSAINFIFN